MAIFFYNKLFPQLLQV